MKESWTEMTILKMTEGKRIWEWMREKVAVE